MDCVWVVFFWWLNPVRLYSLYKILYPKRRIESYSIMGTIVSPNKILLIWGASKTDWGMLFGEVPVIRDDRIDGSTLSSLYLCPRPETHGFTVLGPDSRGFGLAIWRKSWGCTPR